jgi:hypothetical protein
MPLGKTSSTTPVSVGLASVRPSCQIDERPADPLRHLVGRAHPIHVPQKAFAFVIGYERAGHGIVGVESLEDRLLSIIVAMHELGGSGGRIVL